MTIMDKPLSGVPDLVVRELGSPDDPLVASWLELYRQAFPPQERVPESDHLDLLQARAEGREPGAHLIAVCRRGEAKSLAMARYSYDGDTAFGYLMYLGVAPEVRSRGIGGALYGEILRRLQAHAKAAGRVLRGMVIEVEDPQASADAGAQRDAVRRLSFYRRLGIRRLAGIHYTQRVPGQPPVTMLVLVDPLDPALAASDAVAAAQRLLGGIQRIGAVALVAIQPSASGRAPDTED
jgi:ribosomal protein S18 acetylase RimI-like enzyme